MIEINERARALTVRTTGFLEEIKKMMYNRVKEDYRLDDKLPKINQWHLWIQDCQYFTAQTHDYSTDTTYIIMWNIGEDTCEFYELEEDYSDEKNCFIKEYDDVLKVYYDLYRWNNGWPNEEPIEEVGETEYVDDTVG